MGLKKANIEIKKENSSQTVECHFNPSEYSITNTAKYDEKNLAPQNTLAFLSAELRTLSVTLYFSSADNVTLYGTAMLGSLVGCDAVTDVTQKIVSALYISGSDHRPPLVSFVWGNLDFQGFLTSVTEHYTMFDASGKPIRCKLDITIKEAGEIVLEKKKEPFSSPDRTKWKTMSEGMSLWDIAYKEYGDPEKWRIIARANNISNPLQIRNGQIIKIPAL